MLTNNETLKIAQLARLKLTEAELENITNELNQYLNWIDKLQNVNTKNIIPQASVVKHELPQRKDLITEKPITEKILKNAPDTKNNLFTVPKTIE